MSPLLNILLGNMDEIDSAYLSEITELETQVRQKYFAFLEKLPEGKTLNANVQQGLSAFQKGKGMLSETIGGSGEQRDLLGQGEGSAQQHPVERGTGNSGQSGRTGSGCENTAEKPSTGTAPFCRASCGTTPYIMCEMKSPTGLSPSMVCWRRRQGNLRIPWCRIFTMN